MYSLNASCNYKLASFQRNCTNNTMGHDLNYPSFHDKSVSQVQHYNSEMFARIPVEYLTPSSSPEKNTSPYITSLLRHCVVPQLMLLKITTCTTQMALSEVILSQRLPVCITPKLFLLQDCIHLLLSFLCKKGVSL